MGHDVIAIIPAKGESNRVFRKNIIDLGGYPLIVWTIHDALNSKYIDGSVYVSTNDTFIGKLAQERGCNYLKRGPELCQDDTPTEPVIENVLREIPFEPEYIVLMQCTSPFRKRGIIDKALDKMKEEDADSLFFGCPIGRWLWSRDCKSLNYDYKHRVMTQHKKWELIECGDYIFKTKLFKKEKNRLGGKIICYEVDKLASIDIDDEFDIRVARSLQRELMLNAKD